MINMKIAIAITISLYLTISSTVAIAGSYLDCVSAAYRNLQSIRLEAFSATEEQLKHKNPAMARVFHVQIENIRTLLSLDLIAYNYYVKNYPKAMEAYFIKTPLTLGGLAPQWKILGNSKYNIVFNELNKNINFRKRYEYLTSLQTELDKVHDTELFKKAGDVYYPLFIAKAKSEKLKERAMLKLQELGCN